MSGIETGFSVLRSGVMFDREFTVTELQFEGVPVTAQWQVLLGETKTEFSVTASRCSIRKLQLQSYNVYP